MPLALLTASCGSAPPSPIETRTVVPEVPASVRRCLPHPVASPLPETVDDAIRHTLQIARAGADCRRKLEAVDAILNHYEETYGERPAR